MADVSPEQQMQSTIRWEYLFQHSSSSTSTTIKGLCFATSLHSWLFQFVLSPFGPVEFLLHSYCQIPIHLLPTLWASSLRGVNIFQGKLLVQIHTQSVVWNGHGLIYMLEQCCHFYCNGLTFSCFAVICCQSFNSYFIKMCLRNILLKCDNNCQISCLLCCHIWPHLFSQQLRRPRLTRFDTLELSIL